MKKNILKILIGSLCLSALIGIILILFGSFNKIEGKLLITTLLVFGYSIPGLCASTIYERKKLKVVSIIGMILALISCLYETCLVWNILKFNFLDSTQWRIIETLNILCWSSGHISLILLINNKNKIVSLFKNLTIILSLIMDALMLMPLWNLYTIHDFYFRLLLVLVILITLGTIVTPILNKACKNNKQQKDINNQINESL